VNNTVSIRRRKKEERHHQPTRRRLSPTTRQGEDDSKEMTSKAELIQQLIYNIFSSNVEISAHTNKTPLAFQITCRKLAKNIRSQLKKWQELKQADPTSQAFSKQTELVYDLILCRTTQVDRTRQLQHPTRSRPTKSRERKAHRAESEAIRHSPKIRTPRSFKKQNQTIPLQIGMEILAT